MNETVVPMVVGGSTTVSFTVSFQGEVLSVAVLQEGSRGQQNKEESGGVITHLGTTNTPHLDKLANTATTFEVHPVR